MIPTLETARLILRPIELNDAEGIYQLDSDPEVHKYLLHQSVNTKEQAKERIAFIQAQYRKNGIGRLAVIEKSSGNFTGWAGIKFMDEELNRHINFYDLGYRLLQAYWGKGYATEATKASLHFAFNELQINTLYAHTHQHNIGSGNVLKKVGLQQIESFYYEGVPHFWYAINKPE